MKELPSWATFRELEEYACMNDFTIHQFVSSGFEDNGYILLAKCLLPARLIGCTQYMKAKSRQEYNVYTDRTVYCYSIYALRPIETDIPKDNPEL